MQLRQARHQTKNAFYSKGHAILIVMDQEEQKFTTECSYGKQKIPLGNLNFRSRSVNQNQNWFRIYEVPCGINYDF